MSIKTVLLDDQILAIEILKDDLLKLSEIEIVATFTDPIDAYQFLEKNTIDLLFTDISMHNLIGTDLVKRLTNPPMVVFTTAYSKFAIEGYELNIVDYLLKPISFERLRKAVEKAYHLYTLKNEQIQERAITLFVEYKKVRILESKIIYIEGLKDYVKIITDDNPKPILSRMNLKKMQTLLSGHNFYRIHQSFIVNINKVTAYNKSMVKLNQITLKTGTTWRNGFLSKMEKEEKM